MRTKMIIPRNNVFDVVVFVFSMSVIIECFFLYSIKKYLDKYYFCFFAIRYLKRSCHCTRNLNNNQHYDVFSSRLTFLLRKLLFG